MKKITINTTRGYAYQGPHTFTTAEKALTYLRAKFNDAEIEFGSDPNEDDAASVEIWTKLCGNRKLLATAIID